MMKISKSNAVVAALVLALVATNLFWLYSAVDSGITLTYLEQSLEEHHQALAALLAVAPIAADPEATPESVLAVALEAGEYRFTFEKEGFIWVGELGYRFDEMGRLEEVQTSWSPF